jgi:predicted TIM-barrel fold metal-dependent hydrolase
LDYNLARLGEILDRHPNLYADLSARVQEISTIPRFTKQFMQKYQDRIVFGTDWLYNNDALRLTFRTLETADEHFYIIYPGLNHSFWPMNGLDLPDAVLKKIYRDNALQIYERARRNAA